MTRVFAYVRASTSKQVESPETQRGIIEAYCRRHDLAISGFYVDPAKSGALPMLQRPAGREMLKAMGTGDVVVIARLDRISRSFIDFGRILESFDRTKVTLHICDLPGGVLDPKSPISRLLIQILVAFAEYERSLISIRTKEGLASAVARGSRWPRNAQMGFRWEKGADGRWSQVPDESERLLMKRVAELREEGYSIDEIRQYLDYNWRRKTRGYESARLKPKAFSVSGVFRILSAWARIQEDEAEANSTITGVSE